MSEFDLSILTNVAIIDSSLYNEFWLCFLHALISLTIVAIANVYYRSFNKLCKKLSTLQEDTFL